MQRNLQFSQDVVLVPVFLVLSLWIVFWLEVRFGLSFSRWGIYPERLEGLRGLLFGPFLHGSLKHLFNNSVPLLVLMGALFYFYYPVRWKILFWGTLLTGLATWLIGRPAYHIGASGVVYMLAAYLFFSGARSKNYRLIAMSLVVVFLYGGMLWYLFPIDPKISWEGHVSGFAVGILLAYVIKVVPIAKKQYVWERPDYDPQQDPFMQQFDENGNFVGPPKQELTEVEPPKRPVRIVYRYVTKGRPGQSASAEEE